MIYCTHTLFPLFRIIDGKNKLFDEMTLNQGRMHTFTEKVSYNSLNIRHLCNYINFLYELVTYEFFRTNKKKNDIKWKDD